ncbi:hypothetical protein [Pseudomonas sp. PH1b]|uniref:hypothetical protein n=1 Tax=Pseudomonas sp. PH1b TaxID=1397282 RepID=UPI00210CA3E8|nr:hypothetical protein [Pseudomonas sp. PH1b]
MISTALLLSACSGTPPTTHSCYSDNCRLGGGMTKLNVNGGNSLSNSFNQYGDSLLHD